MKESDEDAEFRRRLGAVLHELRRNTITARGRRMTQEEAGEAIGTDGDTVGRWERGANLPSVAMLSRIAEAYQVPDHVMYVLIRPPELTSPIAPFLKPQTLADDLTAMDRELDAARRGRRPAAGHRPADQRPVGGSE